MNSALNAVLQDPATSADLESKGVTVRAGTPDALAQAVAQDIPYWGKVVQETGAQLD